MIKMLVLLVITFAVCWMPIQTFNMVRCRCMGCARLLTPSLCTGHVAVRQVPHSRVAAAYQAVCGHFVGVPVAFHCPLGDRSNHLLLQQSQLQSILDPFPLNCNNCVSI